MPAMDSHFHDESLALFTAELADVGFLLVSKSDPPRWRGTIHHAFKELTVASTMDIVIAPGWPFQPPVVFVQGLSTNHTTLGGMVCMWQEGDASMEWTTLGGLFARIEQWCAMAGQGWEDDSLAGDAYLNFLLKYGVVATFDLESLGVSKGSWGEFHGRVTSDPPRVDMGPGRKTLANQIRGMWFFVGTLDGLPPRSLEEVTNYLPRAQHKALEKALEERRVPREFVPSGGVDLVLFCWERRGQTDLLMMVCKGVSPNIEAYAMQAGPKDERSLLLRAGPDAPMLQSMRVILFGAGALGGHTAILLAESGVGLLDLVDPDMLLPGNVVRHVAGHGFVGLSKVQAIQAIVADHAPWTEVTGFQETARTPDDIRKRIASADIVVDTTGNAAFTGSLAMVAQEMDKPLVSGALYRGGAIGRVQRQASPSDTPLHQRGDLERFPVIPAGEDEEEFAVPQLGCSAPVNNAPPAAVTASASLIVQVALDVMTKRFQLPDEVIDVYRSIPVDPFSRVGRIRLDNESLY